MTHNEYLQSLINQGISRNTPEVTQHWQAMIQRQGYCNDCLYKEERQSYYDKYVIGYYKFCNLINKPLDGIIDKKAQKNTLRACVEE
jgi:hypothetical protein